MASRLRAAAHRLVLALCLAALSVVAPAGLARVGEPEAPASSEPPAALEPGEPDEPPAGGDAEPAVPPEERARELHDEAKEAYVAGRYEQALAKLRRALEFDPMGRDLHYNIAFVAEKLGDFELAIHHYRICAKLEQRPWERRRLETVVERVEAAKQRAEQEAREKAVAEAEPPPTRAEGVDFGSWPYVGLGVAGGALVLGSVFAIHAAAVAPDSAAPATGAGIDVDEAEPNADAAHASAVTANVFFVAAAAAGVATLVLLIIEREAQPATDPLAVQIRESARSGQGVVWRF